MKKKIVHVVPHSHWDREWYFTIEDSNVLLAENMHALLRFLRDNPDYPSYVFDGQYSVIDEYLKWHPADAQLINELVASKRLFIGPWYTQSDTRLVHHESLIRNLLYGMRLSVGMGHSMDIGYLPDVFGQNAYLPSIFKNFGISSAIVQRGIYNDELTSNDLNVHWQSPDGESIPTNDIYFGYGPGKFLKVDTNYWENQLQPILDALVNLNQNTDVLLLPAGGDQVFIRKNFPEVVAQLNQMQEQYHFLLSDYETFMKAAWQNPSAFPTVLHNELVASQKSRIHTTIASQRYDIKVANARVEHKILHLLEPMLAFADLQGISLYPQKQLDSVWKQLFDVHAHDSIGGCNSDDTNAAIMTRLQSCERIVDGLLNIAQKRLAHATIDTEDNAQFIVFNSDIHSTETNVATVIFSRMEQFIIRDAEGTAIPFVCNKKTYISGGTTVVATANGEQQQEQPGYYRYELTLYKQTLAPWQVKSYTLEPASADLPQQIKTSDNEISNDYYTIGIDADAIFVQVHNGERINNFLQFEGVADAGDSYDFSPLQDDVAQFATLIGVNATKKDAYSQRITVRHALRVSSDLATREAKKYDEILVIETVLTLNQGSQVIQVDHQLQNETCDHRVRTLIASGLTIKENYAKQAFGMIERQLENPRVSDWREQKFAEIPLAIHALDQMTYVSDGVKKTILLSQAMKEYQVIDTEHIALTLFRSVGLLGRDDLLHRPGRASGINNKVVETPDAQMNQSMQFTYGVVLATEATNMMAFYDEVYPRYTSYQKQNLNTFESRLERFELPMNEVALEAGTLMSIDNDALTLSSLKQSYDQDGIIVRVFNATATTQAATLTVKEGMKIGVSRLLEDQFEASLGQFELEPNAYCTLKISRGGN